MLAAASVSPDQQYTAYCFYSSILSSPPGGGAPAASTTRVGGTVVY